jgi:hypothetical protein
VEEREDEEERELTMMRVGTLLAIRPIGVLGGRKGEETESDRQLKEKKKRQAKRKKERVRKERLQKKKARLQKEKWARESNERWLQNAENRRKEREQSAMKLEEERRRLTEEQRTVLEVIEDSFKSILPIKIDVWGDKGHLSLEYSVPSLDEMLEESGVQNSEHSAMVWYTNAVMKNAAAETETMQTSEGQSEGGNESTLEIIMEFGRGLDESVGLMLSAEDIASRFGGHCALLFSSLKSRKISLHLRTDDIPSGKNEKIAPLMQMIVLGVVVDAEPKFILEKVTLERYSPSEYMDSDRYARYALRALERARTFEFASGDRRVYAIFADAFKRAFFDAIRQLIWKDEFEEDEVVPEQPEEGAENVIQALTEAFGDGEWVAYNTSWRYPATLVQLLTAYNRVSSNFNVPFSNIPHITNHEVEGVILEISRLLRDRFPRLAYLSMTHNGEDLQGWVEPDVDTMWRDRSRRWKEHMLNVVIVASIAEFFIFIDERRAWNNNADRGSFNMKIPRGDVQLDDE